MIRNIINAISTAIKSLFTNWKTTATFVLLYTLFVGAVYLFFTTPEARFWQVGLTFLLMLVMPILFFMLQSMGVNYTNLKLSELLSKAAREFWKLFIVTLPIILLTWLVIWSINKIDSSFTTGLREAANSASTATKIKEAEDRIKMLSTIVTFVNALIMYFIVPLFSIQLWIATLRDGMGQTLKNIFRIIFKAFAPRSVLTYVLGFVIFGVLPYYLITMRTPIKSPWMDLSVLGIRIIAALLFLLFGWIVTVGALSLLSPPLPENPLKVAPTNLSTEAVNI